MVMYVCLGSGEGFPALLVVYATPRNDPLDSLVSWLAGLWVRRVCGRQGCRR
jgi:hypothetical protein